MLKRTQKKDLQLKAALFYLFATSGILISWSMAPAPQAQSTLPEEKNTTLPDTCKQFTLEEDVVLALCKVIQVSGTPFNHEARSCYRAIQALNKNEPMSVHVTEKTHHDVHSHNTKRIHYHSTEKEVVNIFHFHERNLKNYERLLEIHERYLNRKSDIEFLSDLKKSDDTVSRFLCREFEKTPDLEKIFSSHFKQYEQLNKLTTTDTCAAHEEVRRVLTEKKDKTICKLERAIGKQEEKAQKKEHRSIFHTGSTLFQSNRSCTGNRREPVSDRSNVCRLNFRK